MNLTTKGKDHEEQLVIYNDEFKPGILVKNIYFIDSFIFSKLRDLYALRGE